MLDRKIPRIRATVVSFALLLTSACSTSGSATADGATSPFREADIPSQAGRIYLVTGGTSGIGYESARVLVAKGARVVIASNDPDRGEAVVAALRHETPGGIVEFEAFDLGDLASVRALGEHLRDTLPRLDGLVNNAGIMEPPERGVSVDGFERQFAINYLGHFVLTAEVLPLLRNAEAPRVVTLASLAARRGAIRFEDLQSVERYDPTAAYSQSKLACLMFAFELQRRSDAAGWGLTSVASHPGVARTNLQVHNGFLRRNVMRFVLQPAALGALPTLYALTGPAIGGQYVGPTGVLELRGPTGLAEVPDAAQDRAASSRLWTVSESLTGTRYPTASVDVP